MRMPNPYRDVYTGPGYLELFQRLDNYAKTYDNDERDRDRADGVTDILDTSGDAQVGKNMRFQGDEFVQDYAVQRYNGTELNYSKMLKLSIHQTDDKVYVTQYADGDGDGRAEVHRDTIVNAKTGAIEEMVER